ncbi:hypothetical protein NUW58_g8976 [Xylaria curta]|uniref:Uncharacterized protein n=1 Tax=Xylaria curta TaxID=42375 RepID=A0ACC1N355_9PEZI|nr:hypothetical protein NUW58_g8976 [Xylaria curta]
MATDRNNVISAGLGTHASVLQELIGGFTDIKPANVKPNSSLEELGLDSIAAVQLANALLLRLQLQIHPDELFKVSLNTLTEHIQKSPPALAEPQVKIPGSVDVPSASLTSLLNQPRSSDGISVEARATTPNLTSVPPPLSHSFNPFEILVQSDSVYEAAAQRSGFAGYWGSVSDLQNDLLLAYINEAFISSASTYQSNRTESRYRRSLASPSTTA